jgi:hypothetical protein
MRLFTLLCVCSVLLYGCGDDSPGQGPVRQDMAQDLPDPPDLPDLDVMTPEMAADQAPDLPPPPPPPPLYINLTPTPRARGITRAELTDSLNAWNPTTGQLSFSPDSALAQSFAPGDILAAEVSPLTPYGFLRAVEQVEQRDGSIIVSTRQAFFPEVFTGDFYIEIDTTLLPTRPVGVDTGEVRVDVNRFSKEFQFTVSETLVDQDGIPNTGDELIVSAEAGAGLHLGLGGGVGADYDFPFDVDIYVSLEAGAGFDQYLRGTLTSGITGPVDVSRKLPDQEFTPITLWIGPVPIVIVPAIRPSIRVHGTSTPSTLHLDQSVSFYAGVRYKSGDGWHSGIEGPTIVPPTFSMLLPNDYATGQLTGELVLRGEAMIYGIAGPYVDAKIGLQNTIKKPSTQHWNIDAVFGIDVGLQVDLGFFGNFGYGTNVYMGSIPLQGAPLSDVPPRIDDLKALQIIFSGESAPAGSFIIGSPVIFTAKVYDEVGTGLTINTFIDDVLINSQAGGAGFTYTFGSTGMHTARVQVSSSVTGLSAERTFMFNAQYAPPQLYVFEPAADSSVFEGVAIPLVVGATSFDAAGMVSPLNCATLTATANAQDSFMPIPTPSWGQADRCYVRATFQGVGARSVLIRATDPASGLIAQRTLPLNVAARPTHVPPTITRVSPDSPSYRVTMTPSIPNTNKYVFRAQVEDIDDAKIVAQRWTLQRYCGGDETPLSGALTGAPVIFDVAGMLPVPATVAREVDLGSERACGSIKRTSWEVRYEARGVADTQLASVSWWILALPPIN